jgi:hypothetical protein
LYLYGHINGRPGPKLTYATCAYKYTFSAVFGATAFFIRARGVDSWGYRAGRPGSPLAFSVSRSAALWGPKPLWGPDLASIPEAARFHGAGLTGSKGAHWTYARGSPSRYESGDQSYRQQGEHHG